MQINRLFEIIYILLNKKSITATELAEHFEVSVRTIYRDIDTLSSSGIPIYASQGKGGGISLLDDYILDKSLLSEKEQNEILYALQSLSVVKAPESDDVLERLSRLFNKNKTSWIEVDFSPWGSDKKRAFQFTIIKDAILSRRIIEFNYISSSGKKSARRVEPVKLIFKVNAWYLQGFCLTRNAYRTFKISRMSELLMTQEVFTEKVLSELPNESQTDNTQKWIQVCLKISAEGAYRVYDEFDEKDVTRNWDGSFTVTASLPENQWLIRYILSFGADVEVLSPNNICDMLRDELNRISSKY
ncbi:helix-turn-helix transcriptional regulator [Clostridium drakei]|uniref:Transcriptional regulator n=1 Tax=Clostridium drakei TaxID=332101 RepID=A0A2U8DX17_9CLOT|nr:YafY family protein [Clostridium drakei]AWI07199.1 transcriptional regulator [Clostridium drakei]